MSDYSEEDIAEIVAENDQIFEAVTPKYTLDWYIKWIASIIVLSAMSVRGIPEFQLIDLMLSIVGITLWLWVSILWEDRALILLNGAGLILLINNLAKYIIVQGQLEQLAATESRLIAQEVLKAIIALLK